MSPSERRTSLRRYVHQQALICTPTGAIVCPCVMADVSGSGARLIFDGDAEVPNDIVLVLSKGGKVNRHCKVVRRGKSVLGVRFVQSPRPSPRAESKD